MARMRQGCALTCMLGWCTGTHACPGSCAHAVGPRAGAAMVGARESSAVPAVWRHMRSDLLECVR